MMTVQFRPEPIDRPSVPTPAEEGLRELFFFGMMAAGLYLAQRGMVALSLPLGEAKTEAERFAGAVSEFIQTRRSLPQRRAQS